MDLSKLSAIPYFMEAFQDSVRRYPQQPMFVDAQHPDGFTRAEVDELSARVYAWLKQRGVGREDMVMICLPRGAEIPIAMIGVWKAGAACTVAEDDLPAERISFIQKDSESKLVIDGALWSEIMQTPPLTGFARADDHDVAFALYTSGSTGTPKGVLQEYGFFRLFVLTGTLPSATPETAYAETMLSPFNTVMGVVLPFKVLYGFDCAHILPYEISRDPLLLNRYFMEHNIAQTFLPPAVLRVIGNELSPSLRYLVLGGEGANGFYLDGVTLENSYSMSEACFPLCRFLIDRVYAQCPVGKSTSDLIRIRLLDAAGQEVPAGKEGEICFDNPFFRGYINRPEETREAFRGGLFHSGDLGKWDENGNLVVTGRAGDMLKIGGNRVEPAEIEAAFMKVTGQRWCAVKGFTVGARTLLCLYYQDGDGLDVRRVREEMRAYLPDYMIPAAFRRVETVPLLASGKTDKAALPAPDLGENRPAYTPPVTAEETALCGAFEKAFALSPIGLDDDFFDLGGDSIAAMTVLVEAELPGLSVLDIYEGRTPRGIAETLAQRQSENAVEDFALAEAQERERAHPMPLDLSNWLTFEQPGDIHFPGLMRFDPAVDAGKLCGALNRAAANRSVLSMIVEKDAAGRLFLRYDAAATPHYEVQRVTQTEFDARRSSLVRPFEMYGAPLIHAGVYETEENVYLFVDIHHMIMDGSAMNLFYDDIEKAYNGEPLGQDTYCAYLARQERERTTERYQKARESLVQLFDDARWRVGFASDLRDGPEGCVFTPCRRVITEAEFSALSERLGMSKSLVCIGLTFLALAKLEGAGRYLSLSSFHNRSDALSRNAFGYLLAEVAVAAEIRPESSVAEFYQNVKASWANSAANLSATVDAMVLSQRGLQVMQSTFNFHEISGDGLLASLKGTPENMEGSFADSVMDQSFTYYEQTGVTVPVLIINTVHFSPEKQAAILGALEAVIDRLVALECPETTTIGEFLG